MHPILLKLYISKLNNHVFLFFLSIYDKKQIMENTNELKKYVRNIFNGILKEALNKAQIDAQIKVNDNSTISNDKPKIVIESEKKGK